MFTLRELIEVLQRFPNQDARVSLNATNSGGASIEAYTNGFYHLLYVEELADEGTRRYLYDPERDLNSQE